MIVIGRIALTGAWDTAPAPNGSVAVRLVPSHFEGHGWDPTTREMLLALQEQGLAGKTVLDFGAGVGTLGLAALALGAKHADAVEIHPQAQEVIRQNRKANNVSGSKLEVFPTLPTNRKYDLILCNLLNSSLTDQYLPDLEERLTAGGQIIFTRQGEARGQRGRAHTGDVHGSWSLGVLHK